MKKLIYLALAILAVGFTACKSEGLDVNDPKEYCWEITVKGSLPGVNYETSYVVYVWADAQEVQEAIDDLKSESGYSEFESMGGKLSITAVKSNITNEYTCDEANVDY